MCAVHSDHMGERDHNPRGRRLHLPIAGVTNGPGVNALGAPKPPWLKVRLASGPNTTRLRSLMRGQDLHTVCEEAMCPNLGECWEALEATFLILGDRCTRRCGFCDVMTARPTPVDQDEPRRVADAVRAMGLRHVVLTSVARDDLADGGADHVARAVEALHRRVPDLRVEVLVSDFQGLHASIDRIVAARPAVFAHNVETVERLTPQVRDPRCAYSQSLKVLARAKETAPALLTKTSIMLGLGENEGDLERAFADLRGVGVDVLTLGQYLRPTAKHMPVVEFVTPERFDALGERARAHGFEYVASGPLVRSSYRAGELYLEKRLRGHP